jgi:hypothetical protein
MQNGVEALTVLFQGCNSETLMWVSGVRPKSTAFLYPDGSLYFSVRDEGSLAGLIIALSLSQLFYFQLE